MGVFSVGDTLYDNQKAYLQWSEALKHFKHCISVKESVGDKVTIAVSRPCDNRLDPVGVFSVYAQELMTILKTGKLPE